MPGITVAKITSGLYLRCQLWLAAVLGAVGAVWITMPFTAPPRNGTLSGALLTGTVGVLMALSAVITGWAAVTAVRESRHWRPHAD